MRWEDEGLVIGARLYGESGLIVHVLTQDHGRRAGMVYGGASKAKRVLFEPGNTLRLAWEARSEDALGWFSVSEEVTSRAARVLDDPTRLAAIASVTTLLRETLQDGDEHGGLFEATSLTLDEIVTGEVWPALYVRWEVGVLGAFGFGLDLARCAISGANDGLTHVSPRTGRAVTASAAEDYLDRLLPLPGFLIGDSAVPTPQAVAQGLRLTGHFLEHRLFAEVHRTVPEARYRLLERLAADGLAT
jgi:DNA repair protein RecO (recombination protein O)